MSADRPINKLLKNSAIRTQCACVTRQTDRQWDRWKKELNSGTLLIARLTSNFAGVGCNGLDVFSGCLHPHAVYDVIVGFGKEEQVGVDVERQWTEAASGQTMEALYEDRSHLTRVVRDPDVCTTQPRTNAVDVHRPLDDWYACHVTNHSQSETRVGVC